MAPSTTQACGPRHALHLSVLEGVFNLCGSCVLLGFQTKALAKIHGSPKLRNDQELLAVPLYTRVVNFTQLHVFSHKVLHLQGRLREFGPQPQAGIIAQNHNKGPHL